VNERQEGQCWLLVQVTRLRRSHAVGAGRRGCCTYLLYFALGLLTFRRQPLRVLSEYSSNFRQWLPYLREWNLELCVVQALMGAHRRPCLRGQVVT
jgi:hypothetical protein